MNITSSLTSALSVQDYTSSAEALRASTEETATETSSIEPVTTEAPSQEDIQETLTSLLSEMVDSGTISQTQADSLASSLSGSSSSSTQDTSSTTTTDSSADTTTAEASEAAAGAPPAGGAGGPGGAGGSSDDDDDDDDDDDELTSLQEYLQEMLETSGYSASGETESVSASLFVDYLA